VSAAPDRVEAYIDLAENDLASEILGTALAVKRRRTGGTSSWFHFP
jgi:hypothetical protein